MSHVRPGSNKRASVRSRRREGKLQAGSGESWGVTVSPLRRWQYALGAGIALLVIGALAPWSWRVVCALGAILVALALAIVSVLARRFEQPKQRAPDVYDRVAQIRAARKARFGRKPRP